MKTLRLAIALSFFSAQCFGGGSVSFNGSTSFVNLGNSSTLKFSGNTAKFTASAWFFDSNGVNNNHTIVADWTGAGSQRMWLFCHTTDGASGLFKFIVSADGANVAMTVQSDVAASFSKWHHAAVTVNSESDVYKIYIDGIESTTTGSAAVSIFAGTGNLNIGASKDGTDDQFNGRIADVHIYNKVLTASEVSDIYRCADSMTSNLVGYWPLWDSNSQYDLSVSNIDGTLTNGVTISQDGPPITFCNSNGEGN